MLARMTLFGVALLSTPMVCLAQPDPVARQKLEQASEAIKRLDGLSYRLKHTSEGGFGLEQRADTEVWMLRSPENPERWLIHWVGTVKSPGESELELLVTQDRQSGFMTWVDHPKKEWHRKPEHEYKGRNQDRRAFAWVSDLADPVPLADQIAAPEMVIETDAEHDGVLCDVILVRPEKGTPRRWAIGKDDHLPRHVEWVLEGGGMSGRFNFEMQQVQADPPLTPAQFEIPVPDGYRKVEPPPPPPPPPPGATGTSTAGRGGDASAAPATRVRVEGTSVGDLAPDFELVKADLEGVGKEERLRLSSLRGNVVVLDFWGSWNAKCKAAGPEIKTLVEKFKGRPVRVLGMTIREKDKARPIDYMKQNAFPWSILLDADEVAKQYKARVCPTYFVIGPEGDIVHITTDFEREKTMAAVSEAIEKALAAVPAPTPVPTGEGGADGG